MRAFCLALAVGGLGVLFASNGCVGDSQAPGPATDGGGSETGCTPTTCAAQMKNCGSLADGCGAMLACGSCMAPQTCGATNLCGNPDGPQVTSVSVDGSPGKQARQGIGTTTIHLGGTKLDGATSVTLGAGPSALIGTISADTASALTVIFTVPHGAPLGAQALTIVTPLGSQTVPAALTITEITSAPSGSDLPDGGVAAVGTTESPFRSLTKSESVAQAGDTILLKNGTYSSAASGETFGILTASGFGAYAGLVTLPAGVTVKGESTAGTLVVGPNKAAGSGVAFIITGAGTKIQTLTITKFDAAVLATGGSVELTKLHVHDNGTDGIYVRGTATATLDSVESDNNGAGGASLWDTASITFTGGRVHDNGNFGMLAYGSGSVTVTNTEFDANGGNGSGGPPQRGGINYYGALGATSAVTVTGAKFHDNNELGLRIGNALAGATVTVTNTTFARNPTLGLGVAGALRLTVRGSTFTDNTFGGTPCTNGDGVYIGDGPLALDLGAGVPAMPNTFSVTTRGTAGTCRSIGDHRAASSSAAIPIIITGDTFSPVMPPAGCSSTSLNDPTWYIANPGSCPATGNVISN